MKKLIRNLSLSALALASLGAVCEAPVSAASITGVSFGGSAPSDYYVYDVNNSNQTVRVLSPTLSDVQRVLDGNASSPTGNVELASSSEKSGFNFTKNTSLAGTIGGRSITLSSLTNSDWNSIGTTWFNAALVANGYGAVLNNSTIYGLALGKFMINGGQQRFSDPNISYVNQDDNSGVIKIGLAGHYDATNLLFASLNTSEKYLINALRDPSRSGTSIQASEIVKYTYDGQTNYLYSFFATRSGLVAADDGVSHTGNYEVTLQGRKSVPVPSALIGIAFAGVIGANKLKRRTATIKTLETKV
ncbi:MAG: NF038130 family PEP-CTERM protein [Pseudanabaenaceae cyanobacterium bins.39]|nr:NF038130 family PEP-CTERM protein [Pseudanabaenaceae cyanobacterium bins.39]